MYEKLIWVVDGTLRPTYETQFVKRLEDAVAPISTLPGLGRFRELRGRLLDQWANRTVHVLIDFGAPGPIWWLLSRQGIQGSWFTRMHREDFVQAQGPVGQRGNMNFGNTAESYIGMLQEFESMERRAARARSRPVDPLAIRRRPRRRR